MLPWCKILKKLVIITKNGTRKAFIPNIWLLILWAILRITFICFLLLDTVCIINNFKALIFQSKDNLIYDGSIKYLKKASVLSHSLICPYLFQTSI